MNSALAPTLTSDDSSVTVFRPTPWLWLPIALYAVLQGSICGSLIVSSVQDHFPLRDPLIMAVISLAMILPFAIPLAIAQIRVDAETLQWRTALGWKRVPWRDVLDYFESYQSDEYGYPTQCVALTPLGQCQFHSGGAITWTQSNLLRKMIRERAVKARTNRWGVLGARPEVDWPRTFEASLSLPTGIAICTMALVIGFATWMCLRATPPFWSIITTTWTGLGWGWGLSSTLIFLPFIMFGVCTAMLLSMTASMTKKPLKRQITVSENGIDYRDSKRQIHAAWSEVTSVRITDGYNALIGKFRTVVETAQGSFEFSLTMQDYYTLNACFLARVEPSKIEGGQRTGPISRSSSPRDIGPPERPATYSYRTSSLRLVLFALTSLPVVCCVPALFDYSPEALMFLTFSHAAILPFAFVPAFIGWPAYFRTQITLDDEGVTQQTLFSRKRILWPDVRRVEVGGAEPFRWFRVLGPNTRITYLGFIADSEHLAAEIERRAGVAFPD